MATKEELLRLLDSEIPLLRVVAYQTIVARGEPDFFSILAGHLDDTASVTWWYFDDAAGYFKVSDLLIRSAKDHEQWSNVLSDSLVGLVLADHRYLQNTHWMIEDIEPQERYYSIVREEVQKPLDRCNRERAVFALARYRRTNDLSLIREALLHGEENCRFIAFRAIEAFPDTSLFVVLQRHFDEVVTKKKQFSSNDLRLYCRAIVAYKDKRSAMLLDNLTKKETYPDAWYLPYNREYVLRAIGRNPSQIYDSLYSVLLPEMDSSALDGLDVWDYDDRKEW
ncbi:MAG: hypothetical protein R2811_00190 [Flavobacteriales bacterium]